MKPKVLFFLFLAFLFLLRSASGAIVSSGTATLHGTYTFSFDVGKEGAAPVSVWWEVMSLGPPLSAQMVPSCGIVNLGVVNFNSITLGYLESLTYSMTPIDGSELVVGDVFAVLTCASPSGNYAKVKVLQYGVGTYGSDLVIQWVTMSTTAPSPVSFASAVNYPVGTQPTSVAVGDFNGDGKLDLAVANQYDGTVSVLLGNGDGTFQAAVNYTVGSSPHSVAVGDFNRDGKLDLAVANYGSGNVSVLIGNGDGTFQTPATYSVGTYPTSVAVGDFNGDGYPDLAVVVYNSVSVLLNNGNGTFATPVSYSAGSNPFWVAVGDFNKDGYLDLAVTNSPNPPAAGSVSVLLGKGDGTFQLSASYPVGIEPGSVAVGDFNGDGWPDLAVSNSGASSQTVSVLLNNGDGTFASQVTYTAGYSPWFVAVGDFNLDGIPDLVVANAGGQNVSALLGNGDGTFQPAVNFPASVGPWSIAVGDFNGDGKPDLAVANISGNNVSVLLNITGNALQPGSPNNLSQQYVIVSTPSQYEAFNFDYTRAYNAGTLVVVPNTVPMVSASGITQATYQEMVAGTSLATTTCYIALGQGTDSNNNPLCADIALTCTNANSSTPAGDNCPTSELNQVLVRNLYWANTLKTKLTASLSIPSGYGPTLAMGSDTWSPNNCTLTGPETGNLCPQSLLTEFRQYSTDPGIKGGGTHPTSNSTYIVGCCEPEWSTTANIPMWYNNTTVPVSFTASAPTAPPTPNNNWVAAPNQSITWGWEVLGATPDPTYPVPGDQTATNSTPCPFPWPASGTTPPSFTTPSGETVTVPAEGLYEVHYFSTACDDQEELVFNTPTDPTQNWAAFKTVTFGVDETAPTITTPVLNNVAGNLVPPNSNVTASFTCTDPPNTTGGVPSGLAGCGKQMTLSPTYGSAGPTQPSTGPTTWPVNNFPVPTSTHGPQTLTVWATDLAGNTASASVPYTVCQYVSIGFNPSTVSRGSVTTVTGTLMSCVSTPQKVAITFTLEGPSQPNACSGSKSLMFTTPPFILPPNTHQTVSFPFWVPKRICAGTYNVVATTKSSGGVLDTSSASLTVQ